MVEDNDTEDKDKDDGDADIEEGVAEGEKEGMKN